MQSTVPKIASFLMALLVLLSTFSFTIEKHFCGDFLVDVSYFGNAKDCSGESDVDGCDISVAKKKNCCKEEIAQIEGQDDLRNTSLEQITIKQQFALVFAITYHHLFLSYKKQIDHNKEYSPPKLVANIQVLHEVFLI